MNNQLQGLEIIQPQRGIEAEGFLLDAQEKVVTHVPKQIVTIADPLNGKRTKVRNRRKTINEWIHQQLCADHQKIHAQVTDEEGAGMLEIAAKPHASLEEGWQEVLQIRDIINKLLAQHNIKFVFQSVPQFETPYVPANHNAAARRAVLENMFGAENMAGTLTASLQINYDLTGFEKFILQELDLEDLLEKKEESLEFFRFLLRKEIINVFGEHAETLFNLNVHEVKDHIQRTRLQIATHLLMRGKKEKFEKRNFNSDTAFILHPSNLDNESFLQWMLGHSNKNRVNDISSKDQHAITVKSKPATHEAPELAEARYLDATENFETIVISDALNIKLIREATRRMIEQNLTIIDLQHGQAWFNKMKTKNFSPTA